MTPLRGLQCQSFLQQSRIPELFPLQFPPASGARSGTAFLIATGVNGRKCDGERGGRWGEAAHIAANCTNAPGDNGRFNSLLSVSH